MKEKTINVQNAYQLKQNIIDNLSYTTNDVLDVCCLTIAFEGHINKLKQDQKELIQIIAFLKSCVLIKESLSNEEEERINNIIKELK